MAYSYTTNETKTYTTTPIYSSGNRVSSGGTSLASDSVWGVLGWYNCSVASSFTFKNTKTTSNTTAVSVFFYSSKSLSSFISSVKYSGSSTSNQTINVPSGAKYMLINYRTGGTVTVTLLTPVTKYNTPDGAALTNNIIDTNGTLFYGISTLYDNNGTTNYQIGAVYDNNGTTNNLIYSLQSENITLKVDGDSHSGSIEWHSATYTNSEGYTQLTIVSATVNSCNYGSNRAQLKIGSTNVQDTGQKEYAAFKTAVSDWAGASHSIANGDVITLTGYSKRDANRDDGADNITITMVFYLS